MYVPCHAAILRDLFTAYKLEQQTNCHILPFATEQSFFSPAQLQNLHKSFLLNFNNFKMYCTIHYAWLENLYVSGRPAPTINQSRFSSTYDCFIATSRMINRQPTVGIQLRKHINPSNVHFLRRNLFNCGKPRKIPLTHAIVSARKHFSDLILKSQCMCATMAAAFQRGLANHQNLPKPVCMR